MEVQIRLSIFFAAAQFTNITLNTNESAVLIDHGSRCEKKVLGQIKVRNYLQYPAATSWIKL